MKLVLSFLISPVASKSIKLDEVSFGWDDITGTDVISESIMYTEAEDLIHLKKIAYHNFIDLLKEYFIALTNIEVNDFLKEKKYDYLTNQLVPIGYKENKKKRKGDQNRKKENDFKSSKYNSISFR